MTFKPSKESRVIVAAPYGKSTLTLETGWVAKQAGASVIVRAGDSMVLVTVCSAAGRADTDFFPLTVEYKEKTYAAGRFPGGYIKREGRPSDSEILTCRLIDRPIRPLFPKGFREEVQLIAAVLSADGVNSPDALAICGASAALTLSDLPFDGPVAAVRVARIGGKTIINPSTQERESSDMDFVVAGTRDSLVMVEGEARLVPESEVLDAIFFGHEQLRTIIDLQEELQKRAGKTKRAIVSPSVDPSIEAKVKSLVGSKVSSALQIVSKADRSCALSLLESEVVATFEEELPESVIQAKAVFSSLIKKTVRERILSEGMRIDGRGLTEVRPIECELGVLPRAHGSAIFTRGETQAIVATTLGTASDAQRIEGLTDSEEKSFMLHYNFPPYCTGEVKMLRGTSRREVGHGNLAERALKAVIPNQSVFPYVIRIVSEVTESNGSSSMASVCGGSLSMMDAGVKISEPVSGVAMGLIKDGDRVAVLTDILGDEDHYGDMDFKVCGTQAGISALQMDIKCSGLSRETMEKALSQARDGRLHILKAMYAAIEKPRNELSKYAPVIEKIKINPDKIRDIIGPGGKTIKSIVESTGAKIDIEDDGTVSIAGIDYESGQRAKQIILGLVEEAEIGKIYRGVVKRITDFGAFVEILPGLDGLVHISQLADGHVKNVSDVVSEGEEITVIVLDIDKQGRVRLSRKEAIAHLANLPAD